MTEGDEKRLAAIRARNYTTTEEMFLLRLLDTERAERARLEQQVEELERDDRRFNAGLIDAVLGHCFVEHPEESYTLDELVEHLAEHNREFDRVEARATQAESALAAARERVAYAVAVLASEAGNISRAADIVWDVENGLLPTLPEALKPQALGIREVASQIEGSLTALADHLRAALTPETP